jgi:hypothetical protein
VTAELRREDKMLELPTNFSMRRCALLRNPTETGH